MPPSPQSRQRPCVQAEGRALGSPVSEDEARVTCPQCHRPSVASQDRNDMCLHPR